MPLSPLILIISCGHNYIGCWWESQREGRKEDQDVDNWIILGCIL
jgi:hypothetical protein